NRRPSTLSATPQTPPVCPCNVASGRPLGSLCIPSIVFSPPCTAARDHSRTVPSQPPLASSRPSGLSATLATRPVCPCTVARGPPTPQRRGPPPHPPQPHLPRGCSCCQQYSVATQRHGDGVIEGLGQDGLGKVGARQAGVLRLDSRQVRLPKREAAEVQTTQVATQQP